LSPCRTHQIASIIVGSDVVTLVILTSSGPLYTVNQTYDDDAHLKNGFNVFQDTPADSKDLLFRDQATAAVTRFGIGIDTTRPWHGI
jgi:hypothetical protein